MLTAATFLLMNILVAGKEDSKNLECPDMNDMYDYIVVGAGSAGAALAARLSEDPKSQVLLLEAGEEPLPVSTIPLIGWKALDSKMDWGYKTTRQENCCAVYKNKENPINRGKALGGTSSLNFMIYQRPNRGDLDHWESLGNKNWNYYSVYPYLLKLEDYQVPHSRYDVPYHSTGGPITVSTSKYKSSIAHAVIEAGRELGYFQNDYNGQYATGFNYVYSTTRNGTRCSTYVGYLLPAMNRTNLKIITNAFVTKVITNNEKRATGVMFEWKLATCEVNAAKEIILSSGTINSPQLLMLSGIGPKSQLNKFNIPVVVDLPGVGSNLQDHIGYGGPVYVLNQPSSINSKLHLTPEFQKIWTKYRTGPYTSPAGCETLVFFHTKYDEGEESDWVDAELMICSGLTSQVAVQHISRILRLGFPPRDYELIYFIPILLRPKSRGTVTLRSSDPHDAPLIDPKFFNAPEDYKVLAEIVKMAEAIGKTKVFQQYGARPYLGGFIPTCLLYPSGSFSFYKCMIKFSSASAWHPSGTCKMGNSSDPYAVVDDRLRVYGVKGLRVVDGSIMPTIVAAHTNVACIMIGEKAADMIKEDNH